MGATGGRKSGWFLEKQFGTREWKVSKIKLGLREEAILGVAVGYENEIRQVLGWKENLPNL